MSRNILFVLIDQMRHDVLGALGKKKIRTPNMDKLAAEGVFFSNMYCQSPICVPTRASLLSGRYVFQHRVTDNEKLLPDNEFSFARELRKSGYNAVAIGRTHHIDNGYQVVPVPIRDSFTFDPERYKPFGISNYYLTGAVENPPTSIDIRTTQTACEFMEDLSLRQPFCMQVGYLAPHNPFSIPEPYLSMYNPDEVEIPPVLSIEDIPPTMEARYKKDSWLKEKDIRKAVACYYGLVTMIDDCIGMLVDKLKQLGLYEDTLIIVASDHGDMLGERGLVAKCTAYEGSSKIPCIIRGGDSFKGGKVIDCVTEQIDITATILEYAGVQIPGMVKGKSLAKIAEGSSDIHKGYAFSEMHDWKMIRDEQYKLIIHTDGYAELYDMVNDIIELKNLYYNENYSDVRETMLKKMVMHYFNNQDTVSNIFPECTQPLGAFRFGIGN